MKPVLTISAFILFNTICNAQNFKVGEKIEAKFFNIEWINATVIDVKDGQYKVHYDGYTGDYYDSWLTPDHVRAKGSKQVSENSNTTKNSKPEMVGGIPKLKGTAWWVLSIYKKGTSPIINQYYPAYLFCKNGRFELKGSMGNYSVNGNRLVQVSDGRDQKRETYSITWNGEYLELISSTWVIRLKYNTTTTC